MGPSFRKYSNIICLIIQVVTIKFKVDKMIYLIDLNKINPQFHQLISLMGPKRKLKIENALSKTSKLCHLGSALLYRYVLGDNYEDIIKFSEHGKPYAENGPFFNVSHSHDYAVCYVGEHECGIDIEKINPDKTPVTTKIFTKNEIEWIEKNKSYNFFHAWTRKESISKAIGFGFAYPFNIIPVLSEKTFINDMEIHTKTIVYEDYFISVSEKSQIPDMSIKELEIADFI